MCDPVTAGLILSGVSGGVGAINNDQALRRQNKQTAEGIRRQGRIQSGADKRVGEQIEDISGSTGVAEREESLEGFLNAIRSSKGDTEGALDPVLAANPRFAESVAGGKAEIAAGGKAQAGRLSRIDAPRFQRRNEGARISRTGSDLNELSRQSTAEEFLTRLRVASERPNDFINILSKVGSGVGSALTLGVGSAAPLAVGTGGTAVNSPFISNATRMLA